MSNVVEQLTPSPVNHGHGENGCCPDPRAWEMEMMHRVWAAGLHDAANCFHDALKAKWKLESQRKVKPKTNSDRIRAITDEELACVISSVCSYTFCGYCQLQKLCKRVSRTVAEWEEWLRSPVEESEK